MLYSRFGNNMLKKLVLIASQKMSFKISVEEEDAWSSKQGLKKKLWSIQHRPSNLSLLLFRYLLIKAIFWLLYM